MTPKRPTLPEGTDPVEALRQLQQQLAEARYMPLGKTTYPLASRAADQGGRDAERAAGMNLLPIVTAVEELVADLRRRLAEADPFGPDASDVTWYGSLWVCPVAECQWTHREENAVSSTDTEAAERVRGNLVDHLLSEHGPHSLAHALVTRMLDWPAHCSEWIAGSDPESPDQCPEYASPGTDKCALHDPHAPVQVRLPGGGWTWEQRGNLLHGGHPEAKPRAQVAYPPVGTEWRHGFPPREATTMWRCQRCSTNHQGNPPTCLHCGHTVLDPGHWVALPPAGTEA